MRFVYGRVAYLLYWQLLYQCMVQITIDAYDWLLPDLVGHDRRLASFIIYLYLYRQASQQANWSVRLSHQSIANASGLSRSAVQSALAHLQNRQLIVTSRAPNCRAAASRPPTLVAAQPKKILTCRLLTTADGLTPL